MFSIHKFEGLVAAPFTPMDKDLHLNTDLIPGYYKFLEKNGIAGAFINGTTGEGASLTQKEKQLQAEIWGECYRSGGSVRIINLVGGTCYSECIENALFSFEAGLSAIAVLAPYYFKPVDESQLADFCARIGGSVPRMPVYFYHVPMLTGVNLSMSDFLEKISYMLPNFAGIKYTHEDFLDFQSCLNFRDGAYDLLWGMDESLLPALAVGCKGAVGSTYNYAAPLYYTLIKVFKEGKIREAQRLQQLSVNIIRILKKYGGMATGKAFMKYAGLDCGEFRSPVKNMTAKMYDDFVRDVEALKLGSLLSKI